MLGVCLCASVYSDGYLDQQEGEKMLLKAISLSPSTANYHSNLGMVMWSSWRWGLLGLRGTGGGNFGFSMACWASRAFSLTLNSEGSFFVISSSLLSWGKFSTVLSSLLSWRWCLGVGLGSRGSSRFTALFSGASWGSLLKISSSEMLSKLLLVGRSGGGECFGLGNKGCFLGLEWASLGECLGLGLRTSFFSTLGLLPDCMSSMFLLYSTLELQLLVLTLNCIPLPIQPKYSN